VTLFAFSAAPAAEFDHAHSLLDSTLATFVRDGRVSYATLQEDAQDAASPFRRYLQQLAAGSAGAESGWTRDERLAYWINAYNAFTLKLIVDHYPIGTRWWVSVLFFTKRWMPSDSILQIPGRWDSITFDSVRGPITLGAIEHEILRPEFEDPRIHFAIVCASIGCPVLAARAFRADRVHEQLDEATTRFVGDPAKVSLDPDTDELRVSKIFDWFREDFDRPLPAGRDAVSTDAWCEESGVARWLSAYGPPSLSARFDREPAALAHLGYDWRLNDVPR
jgi:hypothetical protein